MPKSKDRRMKLKTYIKDKHYNTPIFHMAISDNESGLLITEGLIMSNCEEMNVYSNIDDELTPEGIYIWNHDEDSDAIFIAILTRNGELHILSNDSLYAKEKTLNLVFPDNEGLEQIPPNFKIHSEWTFDDDYIMAFSGIMLILFCQCGINFKEKKKNKQ